MAKKQDRAQAGDPEQPQARESAEQDSGQPVQAPPELQAEQPDADENAEGEALLAARAELAQHKDAMLRLHAEMENLRKRLARDLERSRRRALEGFMNDLLPVKDSLERGLVAAEDSPTVEALREGKALTMKMLDKAMADHGLVEIDPLGEAFNPELHEAISMLPSAEYEANTVMDVVQKGYQLNERLIRPARVVVSRGAAEY